MASLTTINSWLLTLLSPAMPLPITSVSMPFMLGCFALIAPRGVIVLVWLFSDYLGRAYETVLWPLLGFFFMPVTTLAYAWGINTNATITGIYLVVVVVAVLMDLGMVGGGARSGRRNS